MPAEPKVRPPPIKRCYCRDSLTWNKQIQTEKPPEKPHVQCLIWPGETTTDCINHVCCGLPCSRDAACPWWAHMLSWRHEISDSLNLQLCATILGSLPSVCNIALRRTLVRLGGWKSLDVVKFYSNYQRTHMPSSSLTPLPGNAWSTQTIMQECAVACRRGAPEALRTCCSLKCLEKVPPCRAGWYIRRGSSPCLGCQVCYLARFLIICSTSWGSLNKIGRGLREKRAAGYLARWPRICGTNPSHTSSGKKGPFCARNLRLRANFRFCANTCMQYIYDHICIQCIYMLIYVWEYTGTLLKVHMDVSGNGITPNDVRLLGNNME